MGQITFNSVTIYDTATSGIGWELTSLGIVKEETQTVRFPCGDGELEHALGASGADHSLDLSWRVNSSGDLATIKSTLRSVYGATGVLVIPEVPSITATLKEIGPLRRRKASESSFKYVYSCTLTFRESA